VNAHQTFLVLFSSCVTFMFPQHSTGEVSVFHQAAKAGQLL